MHQTRPTKKGESPSLEEKLGVLKLEASQEYLIFLKELQDWIAANPLQYAHQKYSFDDIKPLWVKNHLLVFLCNVWETDTSTHKEILIIRTILGEAPKINLSESILNAFIDAAFDIINTNIQILSDYANS